MERRLRCPDKIVEGVIQGVCSTEGAVATEGAGTAEGAGFH